MMAISAALLEFFGDALKPYMVKGLLSLGKLIKSCFLAPPGWLFGGLDFALITWRLHTAMCVEKDIELLET